MWAGRGRAVRSPSLTWTQVEFSVLNPSGPFTLLNPFNKLCSSETQVLMLSFAPRESALVSASPRPRGSGSWEAGVTLGVPRCSAGRRGHHCALRPGLAAHSV